ncbi:hypothetical protein [Clostridium thermobutyricum]|uniref:hypothetical protein n=1 Tax=Clostridium thermobutyricum TaxID=29372 RepID=UPI0018A9D765|nr:hypothetical protein [Clostridium thermobutyricum]
MDNGRLFEIETVLSDWYNLGEYYGEVLVEVQGVCDGVSDSEFKSIIQNIEDGFLHEYSSRYVRMQNEE